MPESCAFTLFKRFQLEKMTLGVVLKMHPLVLVLKKQALSIVPISVVYSFALADVATV